MSCRELRSRVHGIVTKMKLRFRVYKLMLAVAIAAIVCSLRYQYRQAMERDAWLTPIFMEAELLFFPPIFLRADPPFSRS